MVTNILLAAARVLEEWGSAAFTTNAVAERAGISVGSLYQYFPSKEALSAALIEQAQTEREAMLSARVQAALALPLLEGVRLLVRAAIAGQTTRPLLARALDEEEQRLPVGVLVRSTQERIAELLLQFLKRHEHDLQVEVSLATARDLYVITRALVDAEADARPEATRPPLEERVTRALLGYLLVRHPLQPLGQKGALPFPDALRAGFSLME